jgi:hypothetical protein
VFRDDASSTCADARSKQLLMTSISRSTLGSDVALGKSLHAARMPVSFLHEIRLDRVGVYQDAMESEADSLVPFLLMPAA